MSCVSEAMIGKFLKMNTQTVYVASAVYGKECATKFCAHLYCLVINDHEKLLSIPFSVEDYCTQKTTPHTHAVYLQMVCENYWHLFIGSTINFRSDE